MRYVISDLRGERNLSVKDDVPRPASRSGTCCAGEASIDAGQCARFSRAKGSAGGGEVVRPRGTKFRPRSRSTDCRLMRGSRQSEAEAMAARGRVRVPAQVPGASRFAHRTGSSQALSVRDPGCVVTVAMVACSRSRCSQCSHIGPWKRRPTR